MLEQKFNPSGECEPGGFYVTDRPELWISIGTLIASVTLPHDALVWTQNGDKYKVDRLILGPVSPISDEWYRRALAHNGFLIAHIPKLRCTNELNMLAVQESGRALNHIPIKDRSYLLCFHAVMQDISAFQYVPEIHYVEIRWLLLVLQDGRNLKQVPLESRTVELCVVAVRKNSWAIYNVPDVHQYTVISLIRQQEQL